MLYLPDNLVFEGGGVLGIAYLGALQYLYQEGVLHNLKRTAGTSAGAITACITSLNLPFGELKTITDTLNYQSIPDVGNPPDLSKLSEPLPEELSAVFKDFNGIHRLLTKYGWFSSDYFYSWLKTQIAAQFDSPKKKPPYTFADFKNPTIHKGQRKFHDLYIIGTNLNCHTSKVFCFENTPDMEVAQAVKISMSIPLFFETVEAKDYYCDGGVMWNYPINLFDSPLFQSNKSSDINRNTLGLCFFSPVVCSPIHNLIDYIFHLYSSLLGVQKNMFHNSSQDKDRSIQIDTGNVSFIDFNITSGDPTYRFLYQQGYQAANTFFTQLWDI